MAPKKSTLAFDAAASALVLRLSDPTPAVRVAAGDALVAMLADTRLVDVLSQDGPSARAAAAAALGRGQRTSAIAALASRLRDDEEPDVREAAAVALGTLGQSEAVAPLAAAIGEDVEPDVRVECARALAGLGGSEARRALVSALGDEPVRETAIKGLTTLGWTPDSGTGEAILALAKRDWDGLVAIGVPSVALLARTARAPEPDKDSVLLRKSVMVALGRIGGADATAAIERSLSDIGGPVRAQAARELGQLKEHASGEAPGALMSMLANDADTNARVSAASALGIMRASAASGQLRISAETDPEEGVRFAAAQALAGIGETSLLIEQLESDDTTIRHDAAVALGELVANEAVDPLIKALGDSYATVRAVAMQALAAIGWTPVGVKRSPEDVRYSRWMTRAEQETRTGLTEAGQTELLARDLTTGNALVRQAALEALSRRGDDGLAALAVPMLDDADYHVRRAAADTLRILHAIPTEGAPMAAWRVAAGELSSAAMAGEAARAPLVRALREHPANERAEAARTLAMLGGDDVVDALAEALHDSESYVRVNASLSMAVAGKAKAVPHLVPLLADDHSTVRAAAGRGLSKAGPTGIQALTDTLAAESALAREAASQALISVGTDAAPAADALSELLRDDNNVAVRVAAAEALGVCGGTYPALHTAVGDDASWRVRHAAAKSLGKLKDTSAIDALVRLLGDSYKAVRNSALAALNAVDWKPDGAVAEAMVRLAREDWQGVAMVGPPAIDLLGQTVTEKGLDKLSVERRVHAVEALEIIGENHGPSAKLGSVLTPCLADLGGPVRAAAARACGRVELKSAAESLLGLAEQDPYERARVAAAAAMGRCGNTAHIPRLKDLAEHAGSPNVRLAASRALAGPAIGDIALLVFALKDRSEEVRWHAAQDLGEAGKATAIDPLIAALGDAVTGVRAAARASLEQLGWEPVGVKDDADAEGYQRWLTLKEIRDAAKTEGSDQESLLIAALRHNDVPVRRAAVETLAARGNSKVAPTLIPLLDDTEQTVRYAAGAALQKLDTLPAQGAEAAAARVALGDMSGAAELGAAAAPAILRALAEHGPADRAAAVAALSQLPAKAGLAPAVGALSDDDAAVRTAAVITVATLAGDKAVADLVALLGDADDTVRRTTAATLTGLGKTGLIAVKSALADPRADVRAAVMETVGTLETVEPKLVTAIAQRVATDKSTAVRAAGLRVLAGAIGLKSMDLIASRLREDESATVRQVAAELIGQLAPKGADTMLVPALGDAYSEVRDAALASLKQVGWQPTGSISKATVALAAQDWRTLKSLGEDAAPMVAQVLQERDTDKSGQVKRAEAMMTLAVIGGPVAEQATVMAFRDASARVRVAACDTAGRLGMASVANELIALLQRDSDSRVRGRAATALGVLGVASAAPQLGTAASQDDDPTVRSAAAVALAGPGIGDVERLIAQLGDQDAHVRQAAAGELGHLKNPKALDPLIAALSDAFAGVRTAAKQALAHLDWMPFGVKRTADAVGLDRWILRMELSPKSVTQSQLEVMAGALLHPDHNVRRALCEAFGDLGDPVAKPHLKKLLKDTDASVVAAANAALATLG